MGAPPLFSVSGVAAGVDHCAEQDHGCEQLCLNTEESFVCQCSEGFLINEDLKTCSRESLASVREAGHGGEDGGTAGTAAVALVPLPVLRGDRGVLWGLRACGRGGVGKPGPSPTASPGCWHLQGPITAC